ncbi:ATP-dependent RNA helicase dbp4 [Pichia californica]|uniref:ATP-dependent RNA helicase n=1 Tax=Pichia californica TaxID=460514 RepID=A0A9P6WII6_9ASCO|nr:ATP-dependent RNA helicase dbp4 [[Candida] californica]
MSFNNGTKPPPLPFSPPPSLPNNSNNNNKNNNNNNINNNNESINQSSKKKINLTVNTTITKKIPTSNSSSPNLSLIPKIITPSSPSKSRKNIKSPPLVSISPSDSTKSNNSQKSNGTPLKKTKIKLASSRNSFLHGSPLYGEVSNKMSLLFHAAHNESNKKSSNKKNNYTTTSNNINSTSINNELISSSQSSSPRNSKSSFSNSSVLTSTSTNNLNSNNLLDKKRLSLFSNISDTSSHKSVPSNGTGSSNAISYDKSLHTSKDFHNSTTASFISALSTNSISPTNDDVNLNSEKYNVTLDNNTNINDSNNDIWDEGMFDTFNFEHMVTKNKVIEDTSENSNTKVKKGHQKTDNLHHHQKLIDIDKARVVSDPIIVKNSVVSLGISNNLINNGHNIANSAPTTRKPSDNIDTSRIIPPMSNNLSSHKHHQKGKNTIPLQLQPVDPIGNKIPVLDPSIEYHTNKASLSRIPSFSVPYSNSTSISNSSKSISPLANSNTQSTKLLNQDNISSASPIKTESSSNSDKTSCNVSRNGSIHSRASITSTLQKGNYSAKSGNTHKRSSSKGSLHDITTPKSFFKFFSGKKYNANESYPHRNSNSHSHSNSQSSDTYSVYSGQGISPILSSNATLQTSKHNNSIGSFNSEINSNNISSGKGNFRARWDENKRRSNMFIDMDQNGNNTPITVSPIETQNKSRDVYPMLNSNSAATLVTSKNTSTSNFIKQNNTYELKSRAGSTESLESYSNGSVAIPVPTSVESSNNPSASLYSFHNKLSKSGDSAIASSNRNSILSQTSYSVGNTPTSSNPTIIESSEPPSNNSSSPTSTQARGKVKSLVKLGSKSIRYSRGSTLQNKSFSNKKKPVIPNSDWDSWDGHSGSFEKIGPVGKKPNPPGQTISVVTTSNLHSINDNKKKFTSASTSTASSLVKPTIARLSSSSLPTLVGSNENNHGFPLDNTSPIMNDSKNKLNKSIISSNNTSNSNLLFIHNSGSKSSFIDENVIDTYEKFNLNSKFFPKAKDLSNKIIITTNFVDYKIVSFNNINTCTKFLSFIQTTLRNKGDIQIYITDIGSGKEQLGKKLDKQTLQSIWDQLNNIQDTILTFYVTSDDKLKSNEINTSPNKLNLQRKSDHHSYHEETSLYTTSSYTNSINSDSSFDKNQPTPQHLISFRKEPSIDYWNFKDIDRKPSLTRAVSVTHSSISGDGAVVSSVPNLSRKTSKVSVASTGSSLASQTNIQNPSRTSTITIPNSIQISSASDKKIKGSFKVIPPQKPHVDFDNKRASPFAKSNLIAQRFPPAPPPAQSLPSMPQVTPSSPPHTLQSVQSSDSSPGLSSRQLKTMEKPPVPGVIRSSRSKKSRMVSNSLRSLQRSNTQGSLFSTMSSSSGVSVDPFSENKVAFNNFESDSNSSSDIDSNTSCEDDDSGNDEFGLFSKKPKVTDSTKKSKANNLSNVENTEEGLNDSPCISSSDDGSDGDDFDLFQKRPKSLKSVKNDSESTNDITLTSNSISGEKGETETYPIVSDHKIVTPTNAEKECSSYDKIDKSLLAQKRKKVPTPLKTKLQLPQNTDIPLNESTPTEEKRSISGESTNASFNDVAGPLSQQLDLRPPAEVLYNNLEVFFPKADLDSLIIDEAPTNGKGMSRMKSIRIIAQEASRRASYRSQLPKGTTENVKHTEMGSILKNKTMNNIPPSTNASLLRRKSTKMWGQKVVEVKLNNKKNMQRVIPKRGRNGEIIEFAWIKGELIGIGKFGKVYVAMNVTTGDLIAVKQMSINHKFLNRKETTDIVDTFKAEIDSLKDLDHINIVQYLGFEIKDNAYSIFLEYVSGGSIGHLLRKYGKFDEPVIKDLTVQMLHGINYIHSKGILHRDLKADNLLLEVDGVLKISDFGISKRAKDIYTSQSKLNFQGTIFWMAPEIINDTHGVGYNAKVDIWALGCVVMEMFTGERPWSKYEGEGVMYKLGKEKSAPPIKKEIRKEISTYGKGFMKRCFEVEPVKRPTAQTLLGDPFCELDPEFDFAKSSLAKRDIERKQLEEIKQRIQDLSLDEYKNYSRFKELPLTADLLKGLDRSGFHSMTEIQKLAIPQCLKGNDILAAAKTGSGKTLSFLIPVIEKLIFEDWSDMDGLGALIITPTRELAVQIYEVLLKIGKFTQLSAGLVIGGKDYNFEKERIGRVNILIGTPGRLLQHMDESATLQTDNVQMLVLDEADRILDMGFKKTLDAILGQLPASRQTLLFSATQTKSISDLARLSMVNPQYVNANLINGGIGSEELSLPESLEQSYVVVPLNEKLSLLWSFLKSHLQSKILVFMSSSKQVHFIYEAFRKLQPGIPLMKLHGRQKQKARLETSLKFTQSKNCCLFATDVVARGLDFPAIDWVIQLDCPEDIATYVHRVGRCARFGRQGKSMLMLLPSEEENFASQLTAKKIDIKKLNIKGSKKKNIQPQIQSLCFNSAELKYLAQKAFISYCKSVIIQKNKSVFKIDELPLDLFATSYGLPGMPKLKLPKKVDDASRMKANDKKNENRKLKLLAKANDDGEIENDTKKVRTKYDKMFERKNQDVLSEHYMQINTTLNDGLGDGNDDDDDDDEFLTVKRRDNDVKTADLPELEINTSKRAMKKALSKKLTAMKGDKGAKLVFDDDGQAHPVYELDDEETFLKQDPSKAHSEFLSMEREKMSLADDADKAVAKEKRTEKKRRRKELERQMYEDDSNSESEGPFVATLGSPDGSDIESDSADLDKDLNYSEEEYNEPEKKKQKKWFESDKYKQNESEDSGVVEIEQPETIDDLEALAARLME